MVQLIISNKWDDKLSRMTTMDKKFFNMVVGSSEFLAYKPKKMQLNEQAVVTSNTKQKDVQF